MRNQELEELRPAIPFSMVLAWLLMIGFGVVLFTMALPSAFPQLGQSLLGDKPKAFWFLSRSSAFAAFGLLWLSMVFGLLITNKLARMWPGGPTAFDMHQYVSLLGLGFIVFHALILLGDQYINYSVTQLLVPFASTNYRQLSVAWGQLGLYVALLVSLSFYVRRTITQQIWKLLHFLSFALYLLALVHGLWSGTDASASWAQLIYWFSGGSLLFLTVYRILSKYVIHAKKAAKASATGELRPL
ncbi:MAG: hypothetical protein U0175_13045 [Caldilineaceae bacterium]